MTRESSTLIDLLGLRAVQQPERIAYTYMLEEGDEVCLTYGELDRKARALGALLQARDAATQRVLLLYPPGLEYIVAFFGCLYAGAIAVPAYPPRSNGNLGRLQAIIDDAQASFALTTPAILSNVERQFSTASGLNELAWILTDELDGGLGDGWRNPQAGSDTLAFLQYTSGSTSLPKGVMLTHGNLLHNLELIESCFGTSSESRGVVWLPPYHDMGLIGGILQPLFTGYPMTLLAPVDFIQRPLKWLQAIARTRATVSGGPNFAYELCLQKITPEQRDTLDLSTWENAFIGAEPIRSETLERFAEFFAPCGFRREAFYPCYGLAEGTLFVSGGLKESPPLLQIFDEEALKQNRVAEAMQAGDDARALVGCGRADLTDPNIVIVNPESLTRCSQDQVGEIWVSGNSVAQGYWNRPQQTEETFGAHVADTGEGPFLRTGDLGFVHQGELYVTGRLKDLIIIRGRNYYPQDVEFTVQEAHAAVRNSNTAAFSVVVGGEERLVVVQEIERAYRKGNHDEVMAAIRQRIAEEHLLQVYAIVLIKPASIPKTTSGKIQRHACRERFEQRTLEVVASHQVDEDLLLDAWQEVAVAGVRQADPHVAGQKMTRDLLLTLQANERQDAVVAYLVQKTARVLKIAADEIDAQESLHAFGLDSLMAVELQNLIEDDLGVGLSMVSFLEGASLVEIAARVTERLNDESVREVQTDSSNAETVGELPLSYGQRSLWFLQRLSPGSAAYNIANAVRLGGEVDVTALRRAFDRLVERHPLLRTTFPLCEGEPISSVHDEVVLDWSERDASGLTDDQLQQQLVEEADRPFDLVKAPPLRVHLFKRSEGEHVLLLTIHHILVDFWSFGVLVDELRHLYRAEKLGETLLLSLPSGRYAEYAKWQSEMLASPRGESLWGYWQEQLAGELPVLNLATDRLRPPVQTDRGTTHSFRLGHELTAQIKSLAKREGVTLYVALLAAFQVLLHRYTGQEDILVGSPTAGRSHAQYADVIGYFVNPVVLRANLTENLAFDAFLKQVRHTVLSALQHQEYPFALLVEQLQPVRDLSYPPLFQVMFALQKSHVLDEAGLTAFAMGESGAVLTGDLPFESMRLQRQFVQYDLTLFMAEVEGDLTATFEYNTDLFTEAAIGRMAGHFATLLAGIAEAPARPLSELPLVTALERQQLLVEWNEQTVPTSDETVTNQCIHQLFEQQVERTPDAVAVVFAGQELTYRELDLRANQLAHYLRKQGVHTGAMVGICIERSLEMIVGLLGILKAGAAYVPIDPAYPTERFAYLLEDSDVRVLLTQAHLVEKLTAHQAVVIPLDSEMNNISKESQERLSCEMTSDQLAYVNYTSGSTGTPKGVLIPHRAVVRLVKQTNYVEFSSEDVFLQFASISFDAATFEIWGSLLNGARLVVFPAIQPTLAELGQVIRVERVTTLWLTAGLFQQMVDEHLDDLSGVRQLLAGGDALSTEHVRRVLEQLPHCRLINGYGPTESTTFACCYTVKDGSQIGLSVPIGRPIANTQVYVLDRYLKPVPIGVAGELHIGGDGLAHGYLNQPELTAEKFISNPFSDQMGSRLYKTGDLVRYLPDGNLEFLGRIDQQVKIRGFRIELGEIETVLAQHSEVFEAVVIAHEDLSGDKRLVAYLVLNQSWILDARQLRSFAKEKLPDYMIPSLFVVLDDMPLTPNGKVDRRKLPAPDRSLTSSVDYVAPRTPVEEMVTGIWAEVLRVDKVGIYDNFFESGGHSLLATQVISRLHAVFGVQLPLRSLFEAGDAAHLAEQIEWAVQTEQRQEVTPIQPISRDGQLLLSFAQQRLWVVDQLLPGTSTYNIPFAVRLQGTLDVQALERSLDEIIRRHEVLRTTFVETDGQPVQVIAEPQHRPLTLVDLRELSEEHREAETQRLVQTDAEQPFDLSTGPLIRYCLLQLGEQEHVLALNVHHSVFDGWSVGVFTAELAALYEAFVLGRPSPLADLPIQYADYADWQRNWLQGDVLEGQMSYWKQQLGGELPVLELPTDRPRPSVRSNRGVGERFVLSKELSDKLQALSRSFGVTMFMTLLSAYQTLLVRYSGQDEVCVGTPIAGRNRQETEGLIGFFVNTLVLRTDFSDHPTFAELLGRVREVAFGAYAHQDVPFEKLVEVLQPERDPSYTPLFQAMFALQNAPLDSVELPGLDLKWEETDNGTAKFDLTLSMMETEDGLVGTFNANSDLFDRATITRMIGHFQTLLEGIVADSLRPITELPMVPEQELHQLLVEWKGSPTEFAEDLCFQDLFEAQVERVPDAVALVYEGQHLTYRELNARANRLAHHLRTIGVGPEVLVSMCLDRSLNMIVGLLGILKAGGAFVPLDPTHPPERLSLILHDAAATVLVTQQQWADKLPVQTEHVVCLDTDWEQINMQPDTNPVREVMPHQLAYMIYTSGSTGRPKAVMTEHRNLVSVLLDFKQHFRFSERDVMSCLASIAFDMSTFELLNALSSGGRAVIFPRDHVLDVARLVDDVAHYTVFTGVPSLMRHVVAMIQEKKRDPKFYDGMRLIIVGGEAVQPDLLEAMQAVFQQAQIWIFYGPTETTIACSTHPVPRDRSVEKALIGKPLSHATFRIYDQHRNVVPIGVPGELYIGGAGVSRGYYQREDLTQEKFVMLDNQRWYRTGDSVRYLSDGTVEFLGRIDFQVKIRGVRIELGEIEALLKQQDAVREAVVLAREDVPGNKQLVAYVVFDREQAASSSALRLYLKEKLPSYMVPSAFVPLETLPLTANGKINREALPVPSADETQRETDYIAPTTDLELLITAIWQDVLKIERIGIHDNFFDLGGHSLLLAQVHSRVQEAVGRNFTIVEMFRHSTIQSLTHYLSQEQTEKISMQRAHEKASNKREAFNRRKELRKDRRK